MKSPNRSGWRIFSALSKKRDGKPGMMPRDQSQTGPSVQVAAIVDITATTVTRDVQCGVFMATIIKPRQFRLRQLC
jgi:hypothetical protein